MTFIIQDKDLSMLKEAIIRMKIYRRVGRLHRRCLTNINKSQRVRVGNLRKELAVDRKLLKKLLE